MYGNPDAKMQGMELNTEQTQSKACSGERTVYGTPAHSGGLKPDSRRIEAIVALPEPDDVAALKRFQGMVNYLSKFMPHLSEMTESLRRLEDKDLESQWLTQHKVAFNTVKKYLTESPVLKYYSVKDEFTIQCDVSCRRPKPLQKQEQQSSATVKYFIPH